jgi:hypothetical protein
VVFDFARSDDLQLPAATSPELRNARPLGSSAGESTAATPDTTTSGG